MRIVAVDEDSVIPENRILWNTINQSPKHDVLLVVPSRWGKHKSKHETTQLDVITTPVIFAGKSHRAFYPKLGSIVRKHKPDILYVNAEPESVLAWQAARLKQTLPKMKLVFMSWRNIDYPPGEYPYKLSLLNRTAERQTLRMADHCVCRNVQAMKIFARKGFTKTSVVPPGVDTSRFVPREFRNNPTLTVGFGGRLVHEKGVDLLFRAASTVAFDFELVIAGDGPERKNLELLATTLGINPRVQWKGQLSYDAMPEFLRELDVLVLPSRTSRYWKEQFGRILIEAMACGIPVIGSDSGEIPNVIGNAGLIFKEGSVEGLAAGLQRIHDDAVLAKQLREAGLKRVQEEYNIALSARRMQELFLRLAGETKQS